MKKIIIDPHYCSREEYIELTEYLNNKCWDWKKFDRELDPDD